MPRLHSSAGNHPFDSNASIGPSVEVDLDGLIRSSLLPAMPPPGDGLEARRSWVKRRELFGPDVFEPRAQVLPDAAFRIALDLQQPGRIYC
jgi:hypothetical protein